MALRISVQGMFYLDRTINRLQPDEILSVLPHREGSTSGIFRWPEITLPHTLVEVSDLGCGTLVTDEEMAEVLAVHPDEIPPAPRHAEAILAVGRAAIARAARQEWHLLIHCHGGTSRSVAAALLILALEDGPGAEARSYDRLKAITGDPAPSPNRNLILLGDQLLGRGGALYGCLPIYRVESDGVTEEVMVG